MALKIALDTNRYVDLCRGDPDVVRSVATAVEVYVPFVVLAELRAGFAMGERPENNERVLKAFLAKPGVVSLYPDGGTTAAYVTLYKQLRRQGTPIPTNDIWIAALVVQRHLVLYSRDRHFRNLPQLSILE